MIDNMEFMRAGPEEDAPVDENTAETTNAGDGETAADPE